MEKCAIRLHKKNRCDWQRIRANEKNARRASASIKVESPARSWRKSLCYCFAAYNAITVHIACSTRLAASARTTWKQFSHIFDVRERAALDCCSQWCAPKHPKAHISALEMINSSACTKRHEASISIFACLYSAGNTRFECWLNWSFATCSGAIRRRWTAWVSVCGCKASMVDRRVSNEAHQASNRRWYGGVQINLSIGCLDYVHCIEL